MKLTIPGTTAQRSPQLTSSTFAVAPNASYTFTCQMKTSGLSTGSGSALALYLMEQDAAGKWTQRELDSKTGTTGWTAKSFTYTSSPIAVKGYFRAEIYSGYGTVWLDNVQLWDVYGGRVPVAFGGSVTSDASGLTQAASASGLSLSARFASVGSAIKVDATLTDTTGQDRMIELGFRLPLAVAGWNWEQEAVTSVPIAAGTRYENLDQIFGQQTHSVYPFATVRNASAAFSLATPMIPQMNRFSYDTAWGLRVVWDLGLSAAAKTPSKATVSFWIYTQAPKWGFRATAEKYYQLNAGNFTSTVALQGAWVVAADASIPSYQDFGWGFDEAGDTAFDNANGLLSLHYVDPSGWFRPFPGYTTQPSYSTLISALNGDATSGTGTTVDGAPVKEMAQAVINSSPYNELGQYQVLANSYFWYGNTYQIYPVSPDADIPAPSMWSVLTKYSVDGQISFAQRYGNHLDGIFLDDLTSTFGKIGNYRRPLWVYSGVPLTFSYNTRKVVLYDAFSTGEFCSSLRNYLHGKGLPLTGSVNPASYTWFAPSFDMIGGEIQGAESTGSAYIRRMLSFGKSWSNLYVPYSGQGAPTASQVLTFFRQALLLGYFPGFNGVYWSDSTAYERDRPLFKQYMPLIRKIVAAGWKPINYATPSDPAIYVERFDDQKSNIFYLTAQNSSTATTKTFQMTVDGASLQLGSGTITVQELVGNTTISASRSGSNLLFSDTLSPGETTLYQITVASGCDATYGDLNQDGRVDVTDLVILSNYLVGNMTAGVSPFTAAVSKADLDRSGVVDAVDLVILQNFLAGNVACLPK